MLHLKTDYLLSGIYEDRGTDEGRYKTTDESKDSGTQMKTDCLTRKR